MSKPKPTLMYSRNQKRKHKVITLQKNYSKLHVQCVLYTRTTKTTNGTTQNYTPYYTKLCYTTDKPPMHETDTCKPSKLHTNPTQ